MPLLRPNRALRFSSLCVCVLLGLGPAALSAKPLAPGSLRETVLQTYGSPTGSVQVGGREILTFPTRTVVLEDGRLLSEQANTAGNGADFDGDGQSYVNTVAAKPVEWLDRLEAAKQKAEAEKKQILVLFWPEKPPAWAADFEKSFVRNHPFLRRLQPEFVFLKVRLPIQLPLNAGMNEVDAKQRIDDLHERAVGHGRLPALALVSADTRQTKEVPLAGVEKATDRIEFFTSRAIERAKRKPMSTANLPGKVAILGVGVLAATVILFRGRK